MATHTREYKAFEIAVSAEAMTDGTHAIGWSVTPKTDAAKDVMKPGGNFSSLPTIGQGSELDGVTRAFKFAEQWIESLIDRDVRRRPGK